MMYLPKKTVLSKQLGAYVQASTDNPTGWRPGTLRLGELQRRQPIARPVRVYRRFLGDDPVPNESDLRDKLTSLSDHFTQMNAAINANQQAWQAMNAAGTPPSADAQQQMISLRNDFEAMLTKYNWAYRAVFGITPRITGVQGLGIDPATAVIVAAAIAALFAAIVIWWKRENNTAAQIQVERQKATTQNQVAAQLPAIQAQIADAQARGDDAAVQSLTAQYQATLATVGDTDPNSLSTWVQGNWGWMAAALGGIVLLSRI